MLQVSLPTNLKNRSADFVNASKASKDGSVATSLGNVSISQVVPSSHQTRTYASTRSQYLSVWPKS